MLKRFGFWLKMYYLCNSKEERAPKHRVLSSFLAHYKGEKTSDVEKFLREIEFFLSARGFFLGEVGARIADVGFPKVKRYLFSQGADLTFRGSTQVKNVRSLYTEVSNVPHVA